MKLSKYIQCITKDFMTICGCFVTIAVIFLGIYSTETIKTSQLLQIILAALACTLFKFAFANKYELGKKAQLINFSICSTLADTMVVIWLLFFSPNKLVDKDLILAYIIVLLVVKALVYWMMYIDGQTQAKQLNEKLTEFKKAVQ